MSNIALFDDIFDSTLSPDRSEPVTMDEFVEYGLEPVDFIQYLALQQKLQAEVLLRSCITRDLISVLKTDLSRELKASAELIEFCKMKGLISAFHLSNGASGLNIFDAVYVHGDTYIPMDLDEFRLSVERKLSDYYDPEDVYSSKNFRFIHFRHDCTLDENWDGGWIPLDEPLRVIRYNPERKEMEILSRAEVKELKKISDEDIRKIENEICLHYEKEPKQVYDRTKEETKAWIKELYRLNDKLTCAESVNEEIIDALKNPDIRIVKSTDTLNVLSKKSKAELYGYEIICTKAKVMFFSGKTELLPVRWSSLDEEYQISWDDFNRMVSKYGYPKMRIIYDGETPSDSVGGFTETSIFYDLGYTVSAKAGLSSEKRQAILINAINTKKVSLYETIKYLNQMININSKKNGNELARNKWKEDYDFLISKLNSLN